MEELKGTVDRLIVTVVVAVIECVKCPGIEVPITLTVATVMTSRTMIVT
jgi:predicted metal-binding protein